MSDPRLNLSAFAQVNVGPVSISIGSGADSCPSSLSQSLLASTSASVAASLALPGDIGAFANLQLGQGGGTVGAGLANLAAISNSIRINGPPTLANPQGLPLSSIASDPNAGSEFVLGQVGLSSQGLSSVASVNASVASSANIQAGIVYNQVQAGTFTNVMIPTAFSAFQNATALLSNIFSPNTATSPPGSNFGTLCGASPYALDLIQFAPKYKFLFVVQFEFNPQFAEVLRSIDPAFVVKQSTRPNIEFEYQDVNMYNFRTKVPTRTMYQPMTMKFYDDDYNNIFQFYTTILKLISPIANIDIESQSLDPLDAYDNAGGGMGFNQGTQTIQAGWSQTVGQGYAASLGPYGTIPTGGSSAGATSSNIRNVLRRITLFQVYRQGMLMNVYHFYNPKITQMALDEMEMATAGEGNEISLTFSYDSVFIIPGYNINNNSGGVTYNLPSITDDGMYPFGIAPGSLPSGLTNTLKDGVGSGISDGQTNMMAAGSGGPSASLFATVPTSVSGYVSSNPTTPSGTSYVNLPSAPSIIGGGSDTSSNIQGNTPTALANITSTNTSIPDPVTGAVAQSADNSGNVSNVISTAGIALSDATGNLQMVNSDPSSTPAQQAAALQQFQSANANYGAVLQQNNIDPETGLFVNPATGQLSPTRPTGS